MANKTIYVSDSDEPIFEKAKEIAGESLSSVISRALRAFVVQSEKSDRAMKEIRIFVGNHNAQREQRFIGTEVGHWSGFDDTKTWWMTGKIYATKNEQWAVLLTTVCKASLLIDKHSWKKNGDYLTNEQQSALLVGKTSSDFVAVVPTELFKNIESIIEKKENPIEYLDI